MPKDGRDWWQLVDGWWAACGGVLRRACAAGRVAGEATAGGRLAAEATADGG
jgi:hypothetical protein